MQPQNHFSQDEAYISRKICKIIGLGLGFFNLHLNQNQNHSEKKSSFQLPEASKHDPNRCGNRIKPVKNPIVSLFNLNWSFA